MPAGSDFSTRRPGWPRRGFRSIPGVFGLAVLSIVQSAPVSPPAATVVYRGEPMTVPRAEDLEVIRAEGFTSVSWPFTSLPNVAALTRLAHDAGLLVNLNADAPVVTPEARPQGEDTVTLPVTTIPADMLPPLAWRAIGHGTRVVAFDPGLRGQSSIIDRQTARPGWLATASSLARQLQINRALFAGSVRGPSPVIDPPRPASLDVGLLDGGRSWILIATNTARDRVRATAHLHGGVPYGLWLNLIDGSTMAMLSQTGGPQWALDLEGWGVRVYVIDKTLR
jgi:hypothetical protein